MGLSNEVVRSITLERLVCTGGFEFIVVKFQFLYGCGVR